MVETLRKYRSESEADTREFAAYLAALFKAGDIILLEGNLGTGKTFLVQEIARIWNVEDVVTSPTFAIMQHYRGEIMVNHFDFYRIADERELENLGWEEIVYSDGVTFIEWPQLVKDKIEQYYLIKIELQREEREFELLKVHS
jgi:tRNA threonylcarbamoyl adenosine modification protein YjeE